MKPYMQSKLSGLHYSGLKSHIVQKCCTFVIGVLAAVALPFLHIGVFYYIWAPDKPIVNRARCTCDCFDTVFRGRYEWPPSSYKHVYFNSTSGTLAIWVITVLGVIILYEALRHVVPLLFFRRYHMRSEMFALFVASLYPHYYGWWGLISYVNEGFYLQWKHQMFFTLTELLSTVMVLHLCSRDSIVQPWKLLIITDISLIHMIVAGLDQFVTNVIYREGQHFEAARDLALMAPDVFHVLVAIFELSAMAVKRRTSIWKLFFREELLSSVVIVVMGSLLGKNL